MIQKLCEEFDENFTEDDIKSKWNVLLTQERRERQVEKVTRSSGVGKNDVFHSNWEHFQQMTFLKTKPETNSPLSILDKCEKVSPLATYRKNKQHCSLGLILSLMIVSCFIRYGYNLSTR